jgi:hypothetical protein
MLENSIPVCSHILAVYTPRSEKVHDYLHNEDDYMFILAQMFQVVVVSQHNTLDLMIPISEDDRD